MKTHPLSLTLSSISPKIIQLRHKIDILDQKISKALIQRLQLSNRIGIIKKKKKCALYDKRREKEIIDAISRLTSNIKSKKYLSKIYSQLLKSSREYQKK